MTFQLDLVLDLIILDLGQLSSHFMGKMYLFPFARGCEIPGMWTDNGFMNLEGFAATDNPEI